MTWFANLKISGKIITVVVAIMLLMLFLGAFSIQELSRVNGSTEEIATNWLPSVHAVDSMDSTISDFRRQELQHLISSGNADWDLYEKRMAEVGGTLKKIDAEYQKLISSPEEKKLYDAYCAAWSLYLDAVKQEIALSRANKHEEAVAICRGDAKKYFLSRWMHWTRMPS